MTGHKAIFLDRDGVLIKDNNLIVKPSQVEVFPGVAEAIAIFKKLGFKIFEVTNQAAVARGMITLTDAKKLNDHILALIKKQNSEAVFDDVFLCPHHPKANLLEFRLDCQCRKPKSGMLLEAHKKHEINFSQSFIIGDRLTDVYAGKSIGCKAIQLRTGEHSAPLIEATLDLKPEFLTPDLMFDTLLEAAQYLRGHG